MWALTDQDHRHSRHPGGDWIWDLNTLYTMSLYMPDRVIAVSKSVFSINTQIIIVIASKNYMGILEGYARANSTHRK